MLDDDVRGCARAGPVHPFVMWESAWSRTLPRAEAGSAAKTLRPRRTSVDWRDIVLMVGGGCIPAAPTGLRPRPGYSGFGVPSLLGHAHSEAPRILVVAAPLTPLLMIRPVMSSKHARGRPGIRRANAPGYAILGGVQAPIATQSLIWELLFTPPAGFARFRFISSFRAKSRHFVGPPTATL